MNSNLLNTASTRNNTRKNYYAIVLIILTLFCTFFITSELYSSYIQHNEENSMTNSKISSLKMELNSLNDKKQKLDNDKGTQDIIKQFAGDFREDIILNQLYIPFVGISIDNIIMDKGQKLPNGLNMANISVTVSTKDVSTLKKFLDYLTGEKSNIRFVIKNISFPLDTINLNSTTQASISLGMYYYSAK